MDCGYFCWKKLFPYVKTSDWLLICGAVIILSTKFWEYMAVFVSQEQLQQLIPSMFSPQKFDTEQGLVPFYHSYNLSFLPVRRACSVNQRQVRDSARTASLQHLPRCFPVFPFFLPPVLDEEQRGRRFSRVSGSDWRLIPRWHSPAPGGSNWDQPNWHIKSLLIMSLVAWANS